MALDNLRGGTKRVVEETEPLNNLRGGTKRVVIVDGGGGSVDYAKTVQRVETMPAADSSNAGQQFLYSGESDATYTHGYIYENVATTTSSSASAEQTVGSTLSDIAVDLATLESFTGWTTDNSLQIFYTADGWSVDATSLGVTYTGTPNVGDAITITYTAESTTYAWTRIDVQPAPEALPDQTGQSGKFLTTDGTDASWGTVESLPSQTGQSGKFLTTDGTDASWSDKPLVNTATSSSSITIGGTATSSGSAVNVGQGSSVTGANGSAYGKNAQAGQEAVAVGSYCKASGRQSVAVGGAQATASGAIAIAGGDSIFQGKATATHAIQLGSTGVTTTNSDANTFKVANENGNFEIMSADGTIPTARFATDPVADGTYVPTVVVSSGVATRSWAAPSGGGVSSISVTLPAASWSGGSQTVTATGVTASNTVIIGAAPASQAEYTTCGVICTAQGADSLTFTATSTPTNDLSVTVLILA